MEYTGLASDASLCSTAPFSTAWFINDGNEYKLLFICEIFTAICSILSLQPSLSLSTHSSSLLFYLFSLFKVLNYFANLMLISHLHIPLISQLSPSSSITVSLFQFSSELFLL